MTRVKICGITNPGDVELAATLGADWIGLNFFTKSPRHVDETTARSIVQALPASVEPVALIVHEPLGEAQRIAQSVGIRSVQLHADHRELLPQGTRWICAFSVQDAGSLRIIDAYLDMLRAAGAAPAAVLVDAHVPGMFGGTGQIAPWQLLADFKPGVRLVIPKAIIGQNK